MPTQTERIAADNLGQATVEGLLADFDVEESSARRDEQQLREDVCEALNQFNAVHGSFADAFFTL